jgi:hypothetical protein
MIPGVRQAQSPGKTGMKDFLQKKRQKHFTHQKKMVLIFNPASFQAWQNAKNSSF